MIHYTLLPNADIKRLKREYRIRVFILLSFFISMALIIGIISLIPAYIISFSSEKNSIVQLDALKKKDNSDLNLYIKDLKDTNILINKLNLDEQNINYSGIISTILSHKIPAVYIYSIQLNSIKNSPSNLDIIIQGKADNRDSLLSFKKSLEQEIVFSNVEMPISDLAKVKNSIFAIKLKFKK